MRGLSGDAIDQLGYRTTPAVRSGRIVAELLERGCELEGVPGFYRDHETGSWKLDIRASGIMIPDRNMIGEIEATQIRLDRPYKSKFNNLTSVDKYYGTTASCCPHFAGSHDSDAVYLTEGVMKADIAQHLSNALGQPRCFVGLTGVGNINQFRRLLKELATVHINRIIVAFDMDALINENVRNARQRVLQEGSNAGFEMKPIAWDDKYKGMSDIKAMDMDASNIVTAMLSGGVDACSTWSPNSLKIMEELGDKGTLLCDNMTFSDTTVSLASWIVTPKYAEANADKILRFTKALYKGMDYAADGNYEEVAQYVADQTKTDYDSVYAERGVADWFTGKEVAAGAADGSIEGYYKVQQDNFIAAGAVEKEVPVADYVMLDNMIEAGK